MSDTCSSICLEVGLPRHKRFLVCQTYREWQLLNQGQDNSSQSVAEQLARWTEFLDQWDKALDTGLEVHTLGDMNINHLNWTDQSLPASNQTSRLRPLINALFTRILPQGVSQCVRGATRHWPNQTSSGLDHYYTNRPDKLSEVQLSSLLPYSRSAGLMCTSAQMWTWQSSSSPARSPTSWTRWLP